MTGPEHYRAAEQLMEKANRIPDGFPSDQYAQTMAEAQVHATLALAAAAVDVTLALAAAVAPDTGPPDQAAQQWAKWLAAKEATS